VRETLAAALMLALILIWTYGVYCYVQMVRHRRAGVPISSIIWPTEKLTSEGLEFRRRALWSYVAFAVVALLLMVLATGHSDTP
jgi:formate hydrogenlyase subunit 4